MEIAKIRGFGQSSLIVKLLYLAVTEIHGCIHPGKGAIDDTTLMKGLLKNLTLRQRRLTGSPQLPRPFPVLSARNGVIARIKQGLQFWEAAECVMFVVVGIPEMTHHLAASKMQNAKCPWL